MVDYNQEIVSALKTVLPTYHELALTSKTKTPCISYQESNNYVDTTGDTLGYSRITFTVKVWDTNIGAILYHARQIDNALRKLGFKRVSSGELYDYNSAMIQKILTYEALASENYY